MTDTARLRELEAKATPGPWAAVNGPNCAFVVNEGELQEFAVQGFGAAQELAAMLNACHEERDALKVENERMRAVVEAAQAACAAGQEWQKDGGDRKAKTERLIKTNKELDQAVAAMEQNDE